MDAWKRIIRSRKVHTGLAGIVGAILAIFTDTDYTEELLGLITMVTTVLVGGQAYVDGNSAEGAPSDRVE